MHMFEDLRYGKSQINKEVKKSARTLQARSRYITSGLGMFYTRFTSFVARKILSYSTQDAGVGRVSESTYS